MRANLLLYDRLVLDFHSRVEFLLVLEFILRCEIITRLSFDLLSYTVSVSQISLRYALIIRNAIRIVHDVSLRHVGVLCNC